MDIGLGFRASRRPVRQRECPLEFPLSSPCRARQRALNSPLPDSAFKIPLPRTPPKGLLTQGLYFRIAPQAALSLHKPLSEPKTVAPVAKTRRFGFPFQTTPPNPARLGSPEKAHRLNSLAGRFTTFRGIDRFPRPCPLRWRSNHSSPVTLTGAEIHRRAGKTFNRDCQASSKSQGQEARQSRPRCGVGAIDPLYQDAFRSPTPESAHSAVAPCRQ